MKPESSGSILSKAVAALFVGLAVSGCLKTENEQSKVQSVSVRVVDKSGNAYAGMYTETIADPIPTTGANPNQGIPATADSQGNLALELPTGNFQLVPGTTMGTFWPFQYASGGSYMGKFSVVEGQSTSTAIYPRVLFIDATSPGTGGRVLTLSNEIAFAVPVTIGSDVDFCSAGIGLMVNSSYVPPGTTVSVRANNAGEPASAALFTSNSTAFSDLIITSGGLGSGGLTGQFCDSTTTSNHLTAGTYWIVMSFTSVPSACVNGACLQGIGSVALPGSGLAVKTSADGSTWTSRSFATGTGTLNSLDAFLFE